MNEKKRVFFSFASEDIQQVRGLRLLNDNPEFDLDFYDESVQKAIDSQNTDYVARVIREKIQRSSVTVCLISQLTHKSSWVQWELETTHQMGKKVVAMALKGVDQATLPKFIQEQKLTFHAWNPQQLGVLIQGAR